MFLHNLSDIESTIIGDHKSIDFSLCRAGEGITEQLRLQEQFVR